MPQVIVNVDAEGNVKVEAAGMQGAGCNQLTAAIERALGQTTGDVKKPEFHRAASASNTAGAGNATQGQ